MIREWLYKISFLCELSTHERLVNSKPDMKSVVGILAALCCFADLALSLDKQSIELTALHCRRPKGIVRSRLIKRVISPGQYMSCNMTMWGLYPPSLANLSRPLCSHIVAVCSFYILRSKYWWSWLMQHIFISPESARSSLLWIPQFIETEL